MSGTPELAPEAFDDFFRLVYGYRPFRWQSRLAAAACAGSWPRAINLPTSSGKTSCIDVAVFVLAYQGWRRANTQIPIDAPRRIFFVVDRRIIVNEAYRRACELRDQLTHALERKRTEEPAYAVAWWLRNLAGHAQAPPLDCFELRGGIYRDDAWVRSLLQPTVLTSTVDQVGSRLLFRGYGVSDRNLSIHAALTANDSFILLDEAHCSKPFSQTIAAFTRYRDAWLSKDDEPRWAAERLATPFHFIELTATPGDSTDRVFELIDEDYAARDDDDVAGEILERRHDSAKPVSLVPFNASGSRQNHLLAKELAKQADELAQGTETQTACKRIAVVVNRVACARAAYQLLREKHGDRVQLMIGRMRPLDRDLLTARLQQTFRSGAEHELTESHFVVATQCLEVGADLDFDGMVSQCASLDALRQRFGRLNRLGNKDHARGVVVMAAGDVKPRKPDPIYGESLSATWAWLQSQADNNVVNFGVRPMNQRVSDWVRNRTLDADAVTDGTEALSELIAPADDAPVLMPAHLDMLCQTGPRPAIEPEVALFLHGRQRSSAEVRVCWRADLPNADAFKQSDDSVASDVAWAAACHQAIAICPPSSAECLSVPLRQFRCWMQGVDEPDDSGDVLGETDEDDGATITATGDGQRASARRGIVWSVDGCRSVGAGSFNELRPNVTVVLPATAGGWSALGHIPNAPYDPALGDGTASKSKQKFSKTRRLSVTDNELADRQESADDDAKDNPLCLIDIGSQAFLQSRARNILRVHPQLMGANVLRRRFDALLDFAGNVNAEWKHELFSAESPEDDDADAAVEGLSESTSAATLYDSMSRPTVSSEFDADADPIAQRIAELNETLQLLSETPPSKLKGPIRFPGGFAIVGPRMATREHLPRESFDDAHDEHNIDADERLSLADHLADVAHETARLTSGINMPTGLQKALVAAAERHDLGKADPRFQAMLLGSSIDMSWMQPKLWAKSSRGVSPRTVSSSRQQDDCLVLPRGFRHEMLSVQLAERFEHDEAETDRDVVLHAIAAHHGHARPFAPVVIDAHPTDVSLERLGIPGDAARKTRISADERNTWIPHRLDSGIAERFWNLNRRFGWWGLTWLESSLRLADWTASAEPLANRSIVSLRPARSTTPEAHARHRHRIDLPGLDGTNPLGFLSALGVLRTLSRALADQRVEMQWQRDAVWHPVVFTSEKLDQDVLAEVLYNALAGRQGDPQFNALGQNTTVPVDEFRRVALDAVNEASANDRVFADYCAGFGSDALLSLNDGITIQDTALRTMAGAGHQHFLKTMRNLITACDASHLSRTLFSTWKYDDPSQTLSLRFDPLDDNRYALRWRNPSGDPDRKTTGSMLGANRLAIEAIPLLPTAPGSRWLSTTCFIGYRSNDTFFRWPLWAVPLTVSVVQSLLTARLDSSTLNDATDATPTQRVVESASSLRGVPAMFRSQRITVGKVKNFTPAELYTPSNRTHVRQDVRHGRSDAD